MSDKMKQLTIRLPEKLHQQFKIKTAQKNEIMGQVLEAFILKYVTEKEEPVPAKGNIDDDLLDLKSQKEKPKRGHPPESKKSEPTVGTVILDIINQSDGIDSAGIREKTGFTAAQGGDYVYRLKRQGKIEKTSDGVFVAVCE